MSIFSFENGNLVPAQAVDLSRSRLRDETLVALRARALELIDAPLFPVAWVNEPSTTGNRECFIALDPSGQVVTIDVFARLSSEELIAALGAAGKHNDTSAEALASLKGVSRTDFEREWEAFLDVCPPVSSAGPRLYLIVLAVDEDVRPAIEALTGASVSVRLASVVGSGSQVFISVDEVRPQTTPLSSLLETVRARAQVGTRASVVNQSFGVVEEEQKTSISTNSPVAVSLYADSPESAAAIDNDASIEVEVIEETPVVEEKPEEKPAVERRPEGRIPSVFPSRRALRMEREQRDAEQGIKKTLGGTSTYSFGSMTMQQAEEKPKEQVKEQADNSNLTLSTFDIASRPPTPAQTPQSNTPTVPAPESAVSVESTVSVQSAYSGESAAWAESAPKAEKKKTDEDSRAKAIFASLPRFFSKSSSEKRRAEQLLWEQAAPMREGRLPASLISESTAASHSSDAVDQAAENDSL